MQSNSKCGGVRPVAMRHKEWQDTNLVISDDPDLGDLEPAPLCKTCHEKHFGFCVDKHAHIEGEVVELVAKFHSIRSAFYYNHLSLPS